LARDQIEILAMIISKNKLEDIRGRLLSDVFLEMEEMYILNSEINILLLKSNIFQIKSWDSAMENYVKNISGSLQEKAYNFLSEVLK
jgi:hypothetical protein